MSSHDANNNKTDWLSQIVPLADSTNASVTTETSGGLKGQGTQSCHTEHSLVW